MRASVSSEWLNWGDVLMMKVKKRLLLLSVLNAFYMFCESKGTRIKK